MHDHKNIKKVKEPPPIKVFLTLPSYSIDEDLANLILHIIYIMIDNALFSWQIHTNKTRNATFFY